MFTTCPKCSLKLVVTAADLRVAQGYVRCGRCANVFNALAGLSDEQQAVLARETAAGHEAPSDAARPSSPTPSAPQPQEVPSREAEPSREVEPSQEAPPSRDGEPVPDISLEFDATATDVSEIFIEPRPDDGPTGTFESIVLHGEDGAAGELRVETHELELDHEDLAPVPQAPPPAASAPSPGAGAAPAAISMPPVESATPAPAGEAAPSPPPQSSAPSPVPSPAPSAGTPAAAPWPPAAAPSAAMPFPPPFAGERGERSPRAARFTQWALRIGSGALAVILLAQIVNHERAELADIGWLRPALAAVYSTLGIPLVPHWNVAAYEVRQLGAVAGQQNAGALTVRASIKNNAPRGQPLPLLRVVVQDRFGNRIAARDVPPVAYLPAADARRTELGAGQRVDADIAFVDPGPNAVGFEIDACLAMASGRIACANDAAAQR